MSIRLRRKPPFVCSGERKKIEKKKKNRMLTLSEFTNGWNKFESSVTFLLFIRRSLFAIKSLGVFNFIIITVTVAFGWVAIRMKYSQWFLRIFVFLPGVIFSIRIISNSYDFTTKSYLERLFKKNCYYVVENVFKISSFTVLLLTICEKS